MNKCMYEDHKTIRRGNDKRIAKTNPHFFQHNTTQLKFGLEKDDDNYSGVSLLVLRVSSVALQDTKSDGVFVCVSFDENGIDDDDGCSIIWSVCAISTETRGDRCEWECRTGEQHSSLRGWNDCVCWWI